MTSWLSLVFQVAKIRSVFHLIYTSIANRGVSEVELKDLLTKARINNSTIGITGLLIYKDRRFMQLIEGDEKAVQELMVKIKADDRHRGILILQTGHSKEREFTDWSMAFRSPESQLPNDLSDPAELAFTEEALARHSSNATKLLRLFEKHI